MKETWHFAGVPHPVEVLGKQQLFKDEKQGVERNRYWLKGYYPWWGKVIQGWSGQETEMVKEWRWPTDSNAVEHPHSRTIKT